MNIRTQVITFQPLSSNAEYLKFERFGSVEISRLRKFKGKKVLWTEKSAFKLSLRITFDLFKHSFRFILKNREFNTIIHAHGLQAGIVAFILRRIFQIRYVISIHAHFAEYHIPKLARVMKILYTKILMTSDVVLVNTLKMKTEFISLGVDSEKIIEHVQWNTLDFFKKGKPPVNRIKKVIFVGRLLREKGTRVIHQLALNFPEIEFTIVGDGFDFIFLQNSKTPNMKLAGALDPGAIAELYFENDLCLVPSLYEDAYPRVVTEAIGCQTPVIGTLRGGIPESMDQSVGWFVQGTNEEDTVREISNILNRILSDPQELNFRIQNCELWAEEHYSNKIFQKTLDAYLKASTA
jgi:glycosyltransferase involved in cell wall biosynthesis